MWQAAYLQVEYQHVQFAKIIIGPFAVKRDDCVSSATTLKAEQKMRAKATPPAIIVRELSFMAFVQGMREHSRFG
jgi:hypothetical protein